MNTIIIYASHHGTVEKCAHKLKELLKNDVTLSTISDALKIQNLDTYDTIIIGCSIYAGRISGKIRKIINGNLSLLLQKRTGLYLCTITPTEEADHYFNENFPEKLVQACAAKGLFGGERLFEKMNFLERSIIKKIAKTDKSASFINEENIKQFAREMNKK